MTRLVQVALHATDLDRAAAFYADLLGTAFLWLDCRAPIAAIRSELERICRGEALWDGRACVTQVTETIERAIQVRLLVSARSSGDAFDLG